MEQKEGCSSDRGVTTGGTEMRSTTAAGNAADSIKLQPLLHRRARREDGKYANVRRHITGEVKINKVDLVFGSQLNCATGFIGCLESKNHLKWQHVSRT